MDSHINVTVDFSVWGGGLEDLRIPSHQIIRELITNLAETLGFITCLEDNGYTFKVINRNLVLMDYETLYDQKIGHGALLKII